MSSPSSDTSSSWWNRHPVAIGVLTAVLFLIAVACFYVVYREANGLPMKPWRHAGSNATSGRATAGGSGAPDNDMATSPTSWRTTAASASGRRSAQSSTTAASLKPPPPRKQSSNRSSRSSSYSSLAPMSRQNGLAAAASKSTPTLDSGGGGGISQGRLSQQFAYPPRQQQQHPQRSHSTQVILPVAAFNHQLQQYQQQQQQLQQQHQPLSSQGYAAPAPGYAIVVQLPPTPSTPASASWTAQQQAAVSPIHTSPPPVQLYSPTHAYPPSAVPLEGILAPGRASMTFGPPSTDPAAVSPPGRGWAGYASPSWRHSAQAQQQQHHHHQQQQFFSPLLLPQPSPGIAAPKATPPRASRSLSMTTPPVPGLLAQEAAAHELERNPLEEALRATRNRLVKNSVHPNGGLSNTSATLQIKKRRSGGAGSGSGKRVSFSRSLSFSDVPRTPTTPTAPMPTTPTPILATSANLPAGDSNGNGSGGGGISSIISSATPSASASASSSVSPPSTASPLSSMTSGSTPSPPGFPRTPPLAQISDVVWRNGTRPVSIPNFALPPGAKEAVAIPMMSTATPYFSLNDSSGSSVNLTVPTVTTRSRHSMPVNGVLGGGGEVVGLGLTNGPQMPRPVSTQYAPHPAAQHAKSPSLPSQQPHPYPPGHAHHRRFSSIPAPQRSASRPISIDIRRQRQAHHLSISGPAALHPDRLQPLSGGGKAGRSPSRSPSRSPGMPLYHTHEQQQQQGKFYQPHSAHQNHHYTSPTPSRTPSRTPARTPPLPSNPAPAGLWTDLYSLPGARPAAPRDRHSVGWAI